MLRINKIIKIHNDILKHNRRDWVYAFEEGIRHAQIVQRGWQALIWCAPGPADTYSTLTDDCSSFLAKCRSWSCAHIMDVWVDGLGKALSAELSTFGPEVVSFHSGQWEAIYFDLLKQKNSRERLSVPARSNDYRNHCD